MNQTEDKRPFVFLALPHPGQIIAAALPELLELPSSKFRVAVSAVSGSLLVRNFNAAWSQALNMNPRPDYFAMHHADISSKSKFLDDLHALLIKHDAEIMTACVPIKDGSQELSTAVYVNGDVTRLSYSPKLSNYDVKRLPTTFSTKDIRAACNPEGTLLVNTGLWICKFKDCSLINGKPWVESFNFKMVDHIVSKDGVYKDAGMSEDWLASMEWQEMGLKYMATREIPVTHYGMGHWPFGG